MGTKKRLLLVFALLAFAAVGVPADDCTWRCVPGNWDDDLWECNGYYWAASCENCYMSCPGGGEKPGPFDDN